LSNTSGLYGSAVIRQDANLAVGFVLFVLKPQDALELLSFGQVDPKKIALLEDTPPENISQPEDASADQASVTEYSANARGRTILSENNKLSVLNFLRALLAQGQF